MWAFGLFAGAVLAQGLTLHYQERAPYSTATADGAVVGLVATPTAKALEAAGIAFSWARTPSRRQLALIQLGTGLDCGIGWFMNPERAARGKFSRALYLDQPLGALVRADSRLRAGMRVEQALALAGEVLLVKEGYSYGPKVDRLLAAQQPVPVVRTAAEAAQMLRMLQAGRASWMFAAPEEAGVLLERADAASGGLRSVGFVSAPPGESRHLYCSRAVPDAWIARIDRALAAAR